MNLYQTLARQGSDIKTCSINDKNDVKDQRLHELAYDLIGSVLGIRDDIVNSGSPTIKISTNREKLSPNRRFSPMGDAMKPASLQLKNLILQACEFWKEASNGELSLELLPGNSHEVPDILVDEGLLGPDVAGLSEMPTPSSLMHPISTTISTDFIHDEDRSMRFVAHELGHAMGLPDILNIKDLKLILENDPTKCIPIMSYEDDALLVAKKFNMSIPQLCRYPSDMDQALANTIVKKREGLTPDAFPTSPTLHSTTPLLKAVPAATSLFLYNLCETICKKRHISLDQTAKRRLQLSVDLVYTGLTYAISGPMPSLCSGVSSAVAYTGKVDTINKFLKKKTGAEISKILNDPNFTIGLSIGLSFLQAIQYSSPVMFIRDKVLQTFTTMLVLLIALNLSEALGSKVS